MTIGTDLHQFDVYNDGYFSHLPLTYVDGVILEIVVSRMPYEQLAEFLKEKYGCYFQGCITKLTLYLDHLDMDLSEYLSQAITYDMDDLVSKKIDPLKKRYCNDFFVDEMVDWAEMEVETTAVEARTSTIEGVKARNSTIEGVEARTSTKDKGKKDKSVDFLSPCEDELIELRNRMKANRKANAKAKYIPDSKMNEPNKEKSMPADNVRSETFEKHDIYMNELLKSLKTVDKDGTTEDPFISIEKHMERYSMYDETTH
uniref:Uncharacterized protein n=1 Tax=Tanacetum cinerariifolium TaxID=118510 RepID=A0A6L2KUW7_TANCI|nr:hypothetical protein [Tanacetum cinerariifolium]